MIGLCLAFATACGDPGLPTAGSGTGSVDLLFTDAPSDEFDAVNVTTSRIELIGGHGGPVTVFEGHETFDLLALRDVNELFSVADDVPVDRYVKIRMAVDRIQLVHLDGSEEDADAPPHIDLLPKGGLHVRAGRVLVLQIDIDVDKSLYVHEGGSGRWQFRPVVFVNVLHDVLDSRVTRIHGVMQRIDAEAGRFELCQLRRPLAYVHDAIKDRWQHGNAPRPDNATPLDQSGDSLSDMDRRHHPYFRCVPVTLTDSASIFDENADPIRLGDVENGTHATAVGRVHPVSGRLQMIAELVLLGVPGNYEVRVGHVASDYDESEQQFVLELLSGHGDLLIQLQDETRLYERDGSPLTPEAIEPGLPAAATGVLVFSSEDPAYLKTVVLILDLAPEEPEPLHGEIVSEGCVEPGEDDESPPGICQLAVQTDSSSQRVCVFERTFILLIEGEASHQIEASELMMGDTVDVYGRPIADQCYGAGVIVAFPGDGEPVPLPTP